MLVDELGKGTEVRAGAAIAASVLEALDAIGCKVCGLPRHWRDALHSLDMIRSCQQDDCQCMSVAAALRWNLRLCHTTYSGVCKYH